MTKTPIKIKEGAIWLRMKYPYSVEYLLQEQARQKRQIIESILNDKSNNWHIVISKIINEIKKWG